MKQILAIDIGGTHSRFALYAPDNLEKPALVKIYASTEYPSLDAVASSFYQECLQQQPLPVTACIAIAGPVAEKGFSTTNLPWKVFPVSVRQALHIPATHFINDFSAMAWACTYLQPQHLMKLNHGKPQPQFPRVILGPGTGLGEGAAVPAHDGWQIIATEGGHTNFAPINPLQDRLLQWLRKEHHIVSCERVLSGPGLLNIYHFLHQEEGIPEAPSIQAAMRRQDPGLAITQAAVAQSDPLSQQSLQLFCDALAIEASNLALKYLAKGGIYFTGSFSKNIVPLLRQPHFLKLFANRGRLASVLQHIPLYVINHPHPGLLGAAVAASQLRSS